MYKVTVDKIKNRLYLTLSGKFDTADAKLIVDELARRSVELRSGFYVINDIRFVRFASVSAALMIKRGTKVLEDNGAGVIIRVIGGSTFALKIFAKFSKSTKSAKLFYVPTLQDAEKKIEELSLS